MPASRLFETLSTILARQKNLELASQRLALEQRRLDMLETRMKQAAAPASPSNRSPSQSRNTQNLDRYGRSNSRSCSRTSRFQPRTMTLHLDRESHLAQRFLPYQMAWIKDDSKLRLAEKSVRIGWTYADAFKNGPAAAAPAQTRLSVHHQGLRHRHRICPPPAFSFWKFIAPPPPS